MIINNKNSIYELSHKLLNDFIYLIANSRSSQPEVFSRKGVLKICSKCRRTPMPKCDFNKVALQL